MHITKLELKNIKSYDSAFFEFERGTTAIVGENGAGKTTLIEAIAWVLFDLLDYKKDDFLRRGEKIGSASVEFESGLDQRLYVVERDTRASYFVYDPRSKTKIADKKEEVTRFLWQHLGVEPGTDLESLFRRAIGVPQGTFTSIFLEPPSERKKAFDKLLKVEEYRLGATRLGKTAKHIEMLSHENDQKIARAEGRLLLKKELETELEEIETFLKFNDDELAQLKTQVNSKRSAVEKLQELRETFRTLTADIERLRVHDKSLHETSKRTLERVKESEVSSGLVNETRHAFASHVSALKELKEIDTLVAKRESARLALQESEKTKLQQEAERKAIQKEIDQLSKKKKRIEELKPKVTEQLGLEANKKEIEQRLSVIESNLPRIATLEKELKKLRERHVLNAEEIGKLEALSKTAERVPTLQKEERKANREIEKLNARIERDREFKLQIEDGMCPVFSERCLNLKEGKSLDGFIDDKFLALDKKVSDLRLAHRDLIETLDKALISQKQSAGLPALRKRAEEIIADGKRLRSEQDSIQEQVKNKDELDSALKSVKSKLESLSNPKTQQDLLRNEVQNAGLVEKTLVEIEKSLALENDKVKKSQAMLEEFSELDSKRQAQISIRETTAAEYKVFLQNETAALKLKERKTEAERIELELKTTSDALSEKKPCSKKPPQILTRNNSRKIWLS